MESIRLGETGVKRIDCSTADYRKYVRDRRYFKLNKIKMARDTPTKPGGMRRFDELVAISNLQEGEKFFTGFANVINAMRTCGKIIIGRVQGKTVGGGVGLASACDYVLATENAAIKLSELTIGIGPFVIEPVVKRKIGLAALSELTLDATNWKTAYWAKEKGLYAKVFETVKELDEEVEILASKLASYNPSALGEMKKVLWENTQNWNEFSFSSMLGITATIGTHFKRIGVNVSAHFMYSFAQLNITNFANFNLFG